MTSARHRSRHMLGLTSAVVIVGVVLAAGVAVAVGRTGNSPRSSSSSCPTITVVASPDIAPSLISLSQRMPTTFCGSVQVYAKDPDQVVTALAAGWREDRDGARPDVWIPDSSAWVRIAAARPSAKALVPTALPSVVSSPLVIGVPEPVARAYGWPKAQVDWKSLLSIAQNPKGLGALGHPEWGDPRIGVTDPKSSTAGLLSLSAVAAAETGQNKAAPLPVAAADTVAAKVELLTLGRVAARSAGSTADLLNGLRTAAMQGPDAAVKYAAAVPASEQQVWSYNQQKPVVKLAAAYLTDGSPSADYPYATLSTPWVGAGQRDVAARFHAFLGEAPSLKVFEAAGFRRADGTAAAGFSADAAPPHPTVRTTLAGTGAPTYAEIARLWGVLSQPAKTISVWDTSGSMADMVPAAKKTKLQLIQETGLNAISLFTDNDIAETWTFSTALPGGATHKVVAPLGKLGGTTDGVPNRQFFFRAMNDLVARGNTPLYQAIVDAYARARQTYQPGYQNTVIVLTDGKNDDSADPLTLAQATAKLRSLVDPARPIRLVAEGFGADADGPALKALAAATAGKCYLQPDPAKIGLTFLDAITSF